MSTSFLVIQAQRDLAQARQNELSSVLAYDLSLVDFEALQQAGPAGPVVRDPAQTQTAVATGRDRRPPPAAISRRRRGRREHLLTSARHWRAGHHRDQRASVRVDRYTLEASAAGSAPRSAP